MTRLEQILEQFDCPFTRQYLDPAKHRGYPCYLFASFYRMKQFSKELGYHIKLPVLCCDYTGEEAESNWHGYYTGYVVFESKDQVKFAVSRKSIPEGAYDLESRRKMKVVQLELF